MNVKDIELNFERWEAKLTECHKTEERVFCRAEQRCHFCSQAPTRGKSQTSTKDWEERADLTGWQDNIILAEREVVVRPRGIPRQSSRQSGKPEKKGLVHAAVRALCENPPHAL